MRFGRQPRFQFGMSLFSVRTMELYYDILSMPPSLGLVYTRNGPLLTNRRAGRLESQAHAIADASAVLAALAVLAVMLDQVDIIEVGIVSDHHEADLAAECLYVMYARSRLQGQDNECPAKRRGRSCLDKNANARTRQGRHSRPPKMWTIE